MNYFKKLGNNASNFFKKLPSTATNIYKKVNDTIQGTGRDFLNKAIDGAQKAGNYLEKYAPSIANGVAGITGAVGLPELSAPIMGAGNYASVLGRKLKNSANQIQNRHDLVQNHLSSIKNDFQQAPTMTPMHSDQPLKLM